MICPPWPQTLSKKCQSLRSSLSSGGHAVPAVCLRFFSPGGGAATLLRSTHARQYLILLQSWRTTPFDSKVLTKKFKIQHLAASLGISCPIQAILACYIFVCRFRMSLLWLYLGLKKAVSEASSALDSPCDGLQRQVSKVLRGQRNTVKTGLLPFGYICTQVYWLLENVSTLCAP